MLHRFKLGIPCFLASVVSEKGFALLTHGVLDVLLFPSEEIAVKGVTEGA